MILLFADATSDVQARIALGHRGV